MGPRGEGRAVGLGHSCMSVTFEFQKSDERDDTVMQMASGDMLVCPVCQWAKITRQIWSYKCTTELMQVSA
eukprot:1288086-Ditylum_brightwellii.AAC.1